MENTGKPNKKMPHVVTITPAIAEEWLQKMPPEKNASYHQRSLRKRVVAKYVDDMKSNNWVLNGEMIKFDVNGHLVDGQHRLSACVLAGVSFDSFVIYGVPVESFFTIDTGSTRTNGDIFRMQRYSNAALLSIATNTVWKYKNNKLTENVCPTATQCFEILQNHSGIYSSVSFVIECSKTSKIFPVGLGAGMHYLFSESDEKKADSFFAQLYSGTGLGPKSPVLFLRNRLINDKVAKAKLSRTEKIGLVIAAWNYFCTNTEIGILRWVPKGRGTRVPKIA